MRKVFIIARREYLAVVATKGFLIGILVMPILMFGGMFVTRLLEKRVDLGDKRIVVLDGSGVLFASLAAATEARNQTATIDQSTGKPIAARYVVESAPAANVTDELRLELSDRIRAGELYAFVEIPPDILRAPADRNPVSPEKPGFSNAEPATFYAESVALSDVRRWFEQVLVELVRTHRFQLAGVTPDVVIRASFPVTVDGRGLFERNALAK